VANVLDTSPSYQQWLSRLAHGGTDIGLDHFIRKYTNGISRKGTEIGLNIFHKAPHTDLWHAGSVLYDVEAAQKHRHTKADGSLTAVWQLLSRDPLTLQPSILCDCGDHGFITHGRWISV